MRFLLSCVAAAICCLLAAPAEAQWVATATAFVGVTLSSETGLIDLEGAAGKPSGVYGASLGLRRGWLGVEVEVGRANSFLKNSGELVERGSLTTLMGNVSFIVPARLAGARVRPYAGIGVGLVRVDQKDVLDIFSGTTSLLGANLAGGVIIRLQRDIDLRADVRYFRTTEREATTAFLSEHVIFWRTTTGVVFRF